MLSFDVSNDLKWPQTSTNEPLQGRLGCRLRVRHVLLTRRLQPCGEDLQLQVVSVSPGGDVCKSASHMGPPFCEEALFSDSHGPVQPKIYLQKVPLDASKSASVVATLDRGLFHMLSCIRGKPDERNFTEKAQSS